MIEDATPGIRTRSEPDFDVVVEHNVMVAMRDGTRLATDIFLPATDGEPEPGPLPTIFHRTPYDKLAVERRWEYSRYFARRGYAAVMQDVRGTFGSEGRMDFLVAEAEDGFDALEWISAQPWCNGRVGSWGTSYASFTQMGMATQNPPSLRAMVPNQSASNSWESSIRHGGAFETRFLGWALWHSGTNARADLRADPSIRAAMNFGAPSTSDWLQQWPIRKGATQLKLVPEYEEFLLRLISESDFTDFWRNPTLAPALHADGFPDAAVLIMGAWYDSYPRSAFENYAALTEAGRGNVKILMGPWVHGTAMPESQISGDVDFGPSAPLPSLRDLHVRWFDEALRNEDTGIAGEAPIRIFVMGGGDGGRTIGGHLAHGGHWRDEHEWPLARTTFTDFYIEADGTLQTAPPTVEAASTTYRFDPSNPVPSIGGNVSSLSELRAMPPMVTDPQYAGGAVRYNNIMEPGGFNQVEAVEFFGSRPPYLPLAARADVLVYRTDPLLDAVEVTGPSDTRYFGAQAGQLTRLGNELVGRIPDFGVLLEISVAQRMGSTHDAQPPRARMCSDLNRELNSRRPSPQTQLENRRREPVGGQKEHERIRFVAHPEPGFYLGVAARPTFRSDGRLWWVPDIDIVRDRQCRACSEAPRRRHTVLRWRHLGRFQGDSRRPHRVLEAPEGAEEPRAFFALNDPCARGRKRPAGANRFHLDTGMILFGRGRTGSGR